MVSANLTKPDTIRRDRPSSQQDQFISLLWPLRLSPQEVAEHCNRYGGHRADCSVTPTVEAVCKRIRTALSALQQGHLSRDRPRTVSESRREV